MELLHRGIYLADITRREKEKKQFTMNTVTEISIKYGLLKPSP